MAEGKSIWFYVIVMIVGAVIGAIIGEVLGNMIPSDSILQKYFVSGAWLGLDTERPLLINLGFMKIVFGLTFKLTLSSVIGILIAFFLMRKI